MENVTFTPFYRHEHNVYHLEGFQPAIVDGGYLKSLGVSVSPSEDTLEGLKRGSILFAQRLREKTLVPKNTFRIEETDPEAVNEQNKISFIQTLFLIDDMIQATKGHAKMSSLIFA